MRKVLDSLNPSKSVNGLSPRVLKECSDVLALPICRLFKKIVKSCTWPSKWKIGRVSPIWKRESKSEAKNYRPVTVLDNLSLVMERVLDEQLCNFTDCFIPNNQFGFKKRCGTDDFAIALTTEMHLALEAELEALLVALDVAGGQALLTRSGGKPCCTSSRNVDVKAEHSSFWSLTSKTDFSMLSRWGLLRV